MPPPADPVEIVAYDPRWPERFREEATRLRHALGDVALRIDHVGSTSVPGLAAKPVVDIQVSVRSFDPQAAYQTPLEDLGFRWRPDEEPNHRFFRRPGERPRRTNIHVCLINREWLRSDLMFRDFLRATPEVTAAYAALKQLLARQFRHDLQQYWIAKGPFIQEAKRQAAAWADQVGWTPDPSDA
jgi:GrpB-like predicted nucleotidyltransferase (UPF0157 family)